MMRAEYPRPELVREKWLNLNGEWEYESDKSKSGISRKVWEKEALDGKINVPFCPESKLSGVQDTDFINACWYRRKFNVTKGSDRVLLHFEACYYKTQVYVNGRKAGEHVGGYTPFGFDITDLVADGENTVCVYVEADARDSRQPSGKQSRRYESYGCYYTRSTGIWQTVWLEYVPQTYLKSVKMDSDIDNKILTARMTVEGKGKKKITLTALLEGKEVGKKEITAAVGSIVTAQVKLSTLKLWSIETPNLYDLVVTVEDESGVVDTVKSYFGMRSITMDTNGMRINGKYVFQRLVLDQGYYKDGIYTAPTAEDLKKDILLSQAVGFNGARLHERVFERRFLYEADKLGYICWGEYPNWGFDWTSDWGVALYLKEWMESVERDYNHPCIVGWCPTNETWEHDYHGYQNDDLLSTLYEQTKYYDPYRPVIDTSGSIHVKTDIFDHHDYDQNVASFAKKYLSFGDEWGSGYHGQKNVENLPYFMSEYGGIGWSVGNNAWSYGDRPKTEEEFCDRYCGLTATLLKNPKNCALCYTQLYDVEQEQNGIYTYEREMKFKPEIVEKMRKAMMAKAAMEKLK